MWGPGEMGWSGEGGSPTDPPAQHDRGAVGEVTGLGTVTEALQRETKADETRADGEAEFEQEAEQEVVLCLQEKGGWSLPWWMAPLLATQWVQHTMDSHIHQALSKWTSGERSSGVHTPN